MHSQAMRSAPPPVVVRQIDTQNTTKSKKQQWSEGAGTGEARRATRLHKLASSNKSVTLRWIHEPWPTVGGSAARRAHAPPRPSAPSRRLHHPPLTHSLTLSTRTKIRHLQLFRHTTDKMPATTFLATAPITDYEGKTPAADFIVASKLTKKKRSFEDAFGDDAALDTVRPEKRARFFTTASPEKVRRIEEREENRTTPCDNRAMRWMVVEGCGRGMMTLQQAENCTEQPTTYGSEKRGATRERTHTHTRSQSPILLFDVWKDCTRELNARLVNQSYPSRRYAADVDPSISFTRSI